ncbi:MAG: prepilin-type N-terminal cleavage/methylation domain-containing protein [Gemmatimonadetes bacterium]|nr:prepilin-type N-terminal cleavage/methylation domain-containing protein [Gemmatimonadota bacterium]
MRPRHAFTLVELIVALMLLGVGIAAYARAAAAIARLEGSARLRLTAAAALAARLDSLSGLPCGEARGGVAATEGIHETWRVRPGDGILLWDDSIAVPARPALSRRWSLAVACRP